ncbi:SDR family NAD(P)-dependent oxidoreductase [Armatimonas rosea]|uniref:Short-subunit dehydrogenase n=1 Tax=Armatimonas rosea TaxID=685828 RepID=A0A7W9SM44_ARMRO|nr:short-subunit dehydrogenase [Armatimonas rosea]
MTNEQLLGKSILLTGATGGIGQATALQLAREGALLTLSGRSAEKLEALAASLEQETGVRPSTIVADLSRAPQVEKLLAEATAERGLDILVNAAGVGLVKPLENISPEEMTLTLAANLYGAMLLSQAAVKVMTPKKSGHILHVVGILGKAPMAQASVYCASKYGLTGFLQALRAEVSRRHNIKVTGLYLGGVDTPFYDNPAIEMKVQRDKMLSVSDAAGAILYALTQPAHLVLGELTLQPESHQL